jgi:hypothetical protein
LHNTILLLIPSANPDGIDIVANWYRKTWERLPKAATPPELYHHYAGHDNNRDWFMLNLPKRAGHETFLAGMVSADRLRRASDGTNGARFIIPPFFDPPNPNIPPLILREVGLIGYKMAAICKPKNIAGVATNATFRYVVARRFSFGAVLSQFNRHFVRSREREFDVADQISPKKKCSENRKTARFEFAFGNGDESSRRVARRIVATARHCRNRNDRLARSALKWRRNFARVICAIFTNSSKRISKETANDPQAFVVTPGSRTPKPSRAFSKF